MLVMLAVTVGVMVFMLMVLMLTCWRITRSICHAGNADAIHDRLVMLMMLAVTVGVMVLMLLALMLTLVLTLMLLLMIPRYRR